MQIKKLLLTACAFSLSFVLLGCPDKGDTKPDPAAASKDAGSAVVPAAKAPGSAAPAASGGNGW